CHEPYPAVVIDNHWNLLMANHTQQKLVALLIENGAVFPASINLLDHFFAPHGYREFVDDWQSFAVYLLQRVEKEMILQGEMEQAKILIDRLQSYPDVPKNWRQQTPQFENSPMIRLTLKVGEQRISLFSTIAVFGTPLDVTLQSLRIEHYFPADEMSKSFFHQFSKE
ncbi:MAG: XRE family transcriptional regulator, partial [Pseudomonadales bacterium]|nr:XRE family transcriptional regulator [Pseudomonadales bacterium]